VLGGIVISNGELVTVNQALQKYRREEHMTSELKWTKVTNQKLGKYKLFVDHFFALNARGGAYFSSLILDSHQFNHKKFNEGDKELGYYKFLYQLLLHSFGKHYCKNESGEDCKLVVHPDQRTSKYPLERLKTTLNRSMARKFDVKTNPFISIRPQDSRKADLAQLNDILIGAVGFQKNGVDLIAGTRQRSKIDLGFLHQKESRIKELKRQHRSGVRRQLLQNLIASLFKMHFISYGLEMIQVHNDFVPFGQGGVALVVNDAAMTVAHLSSTLLLMIW